MIVLQDAPISVLAPVFNRAGTLLSVRNQTSITDYRVADWLPVYSYGRYVTATAFSPDGVTQLIAEENVIRFVHPLEGTVTGAVAGSPAIVTALAFFPDGQAFIAGNADGMVSIWSLSPVEQWHLVP